MSALMASAEAALGLPLSCTGHLRGGDLSDICSAVMPDGTKVVIKNGPSPETEAVMLTALSRAGAPAPNVIAAEADVLVLGYCDNDGALSNTWADVGRTLKTLHSAHVSRYGWPQDYAFGGLKIVNSWSGDWPSFWRDNRLACHLSHLPSALGKRLETLCADLPTLIPKTPIPSLLHGDLWGGNILSAKDHSCTLIDPACYYGDAQVDVAMLHVFNQPSAAFWDAYEGTRDAGFDQRQAIYQLWPALVHVRLFGSSYHGMVLRCLDRAGF